MDERNMKWVENKLFALKLKDTSFVLGLMLRKPYVLFFNTFSENGIWSEEDILKAPQLFITAIITKQFFKFSTIQILEYNYDIKKVILPTRWIETDASASIMCVYKGTSKELSFMYIGTQNGGKLIERNLYANVGDSKIIQEKIRINDNETIDQHEIYGVLQLFPQLNERLYLCKLLGRNVDPDKDLSFNRDIPAEYETYMKMLAEVGSLHEWGY